MEYKIIQVNNYLLAVVNDKKRGWFYCVRRKFFFHDEGEDVLCCNGDLSVEAHLPLNGADIIENLPLLPPLEQEDDVEKMAKEEILYNDAKREWWKQGYNKAKEKYKYTEEDMREMFEAAIGLSSFSDTDDNKFQYALQSISQPKMPVGFECEMEVIGVTDDDMNKIEELKTTSNSQGQTVLIGKYIY